MDVSLDWAHDNQSLFWEMVMTLKRCLAVLAGMAFLGGSYLYASSYCLGTCPWHDKPLAGSVVTEQKGKLVTAVCTYECGCKLERRGDGSGGPIGDPGGPQK